MGQTLSYESIYSSMFIKSDLFVGHVTTLLICSCNCHHSLKNSHLQWHLSEHWMISLPYFIKLNWIEVEPDIIAGNVFLPAWGQGSVNPLHNRKCNVTTWLLIETQKIKQWKVMQGRYDLYPCSKKKCSPLSWTLSVCLLS